MIFWNATPPSLSGIFNCQFHDFSMLVAKSGCSVETVEMCLFWQWKIDTFNPDMMVWQLYYNHLITNFPIFRQNIGWGKNSGLEKKPSPDVFFPLCPLFFAHSGSDAWNRSKGKHFMLWSISVKLNLWLSPILWAKEREQQYLGTPHEEGTTFLHGIHWYFS